MVADEEPPAKQMKTSDDTDDPLKALCRDTKQTQTLAPEVMQNLANALTTIAQQGLTEPAVKQRMEPLLVPENMPCLGEMPVNPEIWKTLQVQTRTTDAGLQFVHKLLTKGIIPLVNLADTLIKHVNKEEELPSPNLMLRKVTDGLGLLMTADNQLHRERKRLIQPELKDCFKELAKKENPVQENLFGPDLAKQVKDLEERQKVSHTLTKYNPHGKPQRFQNNRQGNRRQGNIFRKNNGGFNKGNSFLGPRKPGNQSYQSNQSYQNKNNNGSKNQRWGNKKPWSQNQK